MVPKKSDREITGNDMPATDPEREFQSADEVYNFLLTTEGSKWKEIIDGLSPALKKELTLLLKDQRRQKRSRKHRGAEGHRKFVKIAESRPRAELHLDYGSCESEGVLILPSEALKVPDIEPLTGILSHVLFGCSEVPSAQRRSVSLVNRYLNWFSTAFWSFYLRSEITRHTPLDPPEKRESRMKKSMEWQVIYHGNTNCELAQKCRKFGMTALDSMPWSRRRLTQKMERFFRRCHPHICQRFDAEKSAIGGMSAVSASAGVCEVDSPGTSSSPPADGAAGTAGPVKAEEEAENADNPRPMDNIEPFLPAYEVKTPLLQTIPVTAAEVLRKNVFEDPGESLRELREKRDASRRSALVAASKERSLLVQWANRCAAGAGAPPPEERGSRMLLPSAIVDLLIYLHVERLEAVGELAAALRAAGIRTTDKLCRRSADNNLQDLLSASAYSRFNAIHYDHYSVAVTILMELIDAPMFRITNASRDQLEVSKGHKSEQDEQDETTPVSVAEITADAETAAVVTPAIPPVEDRQHRQDIRSQLDSLLVDFLRLQSSEEVTSAGPEEMMNLFVRRAEESAGIPQPPISDFALYVSLNLRQRLWETLLFELAGREESAGGLPDRGGASDSGLEDLCPAAKTEPLTVSSLVLEMRDQFNALQADPSDVRWRTHLEMTAQFRSYAAAVQRVIAISRLVDAVVEGSPNEQSPPS